MARFLPIEKEADLPSTTEARESLGVDFKAMIDPKAWWELAKDIAALASHVGGVILVGAKEQPDGSPVYFGLDESDAERAMKAYEDALAQHCVPRPIARPKIVELPSGKLLVAVNVEPFPDQPVAARFPGINKKSAPETSDAWRFPVRVGRDTRWLSPDQLPLLTNPVVRRHVILLEQIAVTERTILHLVWRNPSNHSTLRQ